VRAIAAIAPARAGFLERRAAAWIESYWNAAHLERTLDWALHLRPDADEALRLAALTHDIERTVPGGPRLDAWRRGWDDPDYLRTHCLRSAALVDAWLCDHGAWTGLRDAVSALILEHELGGSPDGDVLQAADSLSFLEVNGDLPRRWVLAGRCPPRKARAKLDWMLERIRVPRARELADPLHRRAAARLR
jgi:hypothetical protein